MSHKGAARGGIVPAMDRGLVVLLITVGFALAAAAWDAGAGYPASTRIWLTVKGMTLYVGAYALAITALLMLTDG